MVVSLEQTCRYMDQAYKINYVLEYAQMCLGPMQSRNIS